MILTSFIRKKTNKNLNAVGTNSHVTTDSFNWKGNQPAYKFDVSKCFLLQYQLRSNGILLHPFSDQSDTLYDKIRSRFNNLRRQSYSELHAEERNILHFYCLSGEQVHGICTN